METSAKAISTDLLGSYCRLKVELEQEITVLPGQFAMLKPMATLEPLLRRAMAFYDVCSSHGRTYAEFIFRILGRGTQALAAVKPGDEVAFLGPLGKPFDLRPAIGHKALLVGGGIGTPALYLLAKALVACNIPTTAVLGARSLADLVAVEDFANICTTILTTDDGSAGHKGLVTEVVAELLDQNSGCVVYTCGPEVMMAKVAELATNHKAACYVSMEARMACGFGVCVGCVVETMTSTAGCSDSSTETDYVRVCIEGPVFDARVVVW